MDVSEGGLGDVQPLQIGKVLAEEDSALQGGESGVSHVEDLCVAGHHVGDLSVEGPGAVHGDLTGSPQTFTVVWTAGSWTGSDHRDDDQSQQ